MIKHAGKNNRLVFQSAIIALLGLVVFAAALPAIAQDETEPSITVQQPGVAPLPDNAAAEAAAQPPAAEQEDKKPVAKGLDPNDIGPIVFTPWERAAINDARRARKTGTLSPELQQVVLTAPEPPPGEVKPRPPPEEREITLGGILYVSGEDWTIWLNGKRITPKAIPLEVRDLKVHEGYVEMKWFDDYSNQLFPLRLRPHQRFNIDTRVFLPG